ncbi:Ribosomal protein S18 acetylase RimI [Desulfonispora thiosulfatigenes DSM 11270]|uniref:Ribosomal protein S18 acetylase RimI n=1 Tax=Desulfonispora thiosulfatigenes DSM 11270 TaxID=656914 RepID=A0A1W1UK32_DESTI|nr:GNAT family N-acetyltransferase [Desulfonispora thiosulfatigenes]SMB81440.1 Ribosomal protein S18 acetylase RimI [Desulfonispora thiosulfatigenes DSM 11270]
MDSLQETWEVFWEIYNDSFPEDEKRNLQAQKRLLDNPKYKILPYKAKNETIGFCTVWELGDFLYVEHAATHQKVRGKGHGEKMYQGLIKEYPTKIVLEVEPPDTEIAKRRINFYQRLGFKLNSYDYVQPAYDESKKPVPLMIMSYPNNLVKDEFVDVRDTLYEQVHGLK